MKKFVLMVSLALALMVVGVSSASAEVARFGGDSGQPVASGDLSGEGAHGVLHCQAFVDILYPGAGIKAPGVIVVHKNGKFQPVGPCADAF